jgi:hypothetical protein
MISQSFTIGSLSFSYIMYNIMGGIFSCLMMMEAENTILAIC